MDSIDLSFNAFNLFLYTLYLQVSCNIIHMTIFIKQNKAEVVHEHKTLNLL